MVIKKFALPVFYAATALAAIVAAYSLPATPPSDSSDVVIVEEASDTDGTQDGEHAVEPSKAQGDHGKAVSTAAHCPVKGRAHGELVRSIAQDKEATVEDAQEACDDAVEAAELAESEGNDKGKPEHAGKPEGKGKPDDSESTTQDAKSKKSKEETTTDEADDSGSSDSHGGGPPDDKGKSDKP